MSLATRQAMLMLSMVSGSLKLIGAEPGLPPEVAPTILWADEFCENLLDRYPETGDPVKNRRWMKEHLAKWDRIGADKMIRWHTAVVATFALNFVEDLLDKVRNEARADLETLRDALIRISYFFTDGEDVAMFDEATEVTNDLYAVIGFVR